MSGANAGLIGIALPRRFALVRDADISGVSGVGVVAFGVEFPDGRCATRWNAALAQTTVWDTIDHIKAIHGHEGSTRLVWLDQPVSPGSQVLNAADVGALSESRT